MTSAILVGIEVNKSNRVVIWEGFPGLLYVPTKFIIPRIRIQAPVVLYIVLQPVPESHNGYTDKQLPVMKIPLRKTSCDITGDPHRTHRINC